MNKFEKSELLTIENLTTLLESTEPTERADVVVPTLKKLIFSYGKSTFKYNKDTIAYDNTEELNEGTLSTMISGLITQSKRNLDDKTTRDFEKRYPKGFNLLSEMNTISKYSKCAMVALKDETYKFADPQLNKIHFKNGYCDLLTGEFKKRERNVDFVNFYINRDYKQPKKESIKKIYEIIDQIYTNKNDRDYLLQAFGIAMTGKSTQQQKILFFIGKGSAGKSTILSMLKLAFNEYVFELDASTFSKSTSKSDINKILNTYLLNRNIRISNVNEPKDTRMDESLFKDFIDGNIKTTSLYQDGQNLFKHLSKICMTANTMPKIKMDSGVKRRIEAYNHTSKFVEKDEEIDEESQVYKKDEGLLQAIEENDELLNAISYIIFSQAVKFNKGEILKQTPSFQEFKDEIIQSNDIIQDFIDKYIIKTDSENDRVSKIEMHNKFKEFQPRSNITIEQLRDDLKNKDFVYEWKPKMNGIQGIYLKCRINHNGFDDDLENDRIDNTANETKKYIDEIEKLKAEIQRLNKIIEQPVIPKVVVQPKETKKITVIDDDLEKDLQELENIPAVRNAIKKPIKRSVIVDSEDEEENDDVASLF
jgi:phage/plasmid-associated DNA primase